MWHIVPLKQHRGGEVYSRSLDAVPEFDGLVEGRAGEDPGVGREEDLVDWLLVAGEAGDVLLLHLRVPQTQREVVWRWY